jgi:hypothetical protein
MKFSVSVDPTSVFLSTVQLGRQECLAKKKKENRKEKQRETKMKENRKK